MQFPLLSRHIMEHSGVSDEHLMRSFDSLLTGNKVSKRRLSIRSGSEITAFDVVRRLALIETKNLRRNW